MQKSVEQFLWRHVYFTLFWCRMEKHLGFLERGCRLCGKTFSEVKTVQNCDKTAFRRELLNFFGVDIGLDSREIHPQKVCSACRRVVYHLNSGNLDPETSEGRKQGIKLFVWKEHSSNCYCLQNLKTREGLQRRNYATVQTSAIFDYWIKMSMLTI